MMEDEKNTILWWTIGTNKGGTWGILVQLLTPPICADKLKQIPGFVLIKGHCVIKSSLFSKFPCYRLEETWAVKYCTKQHAPLPPLCFMQVETVFTPAQSCGCCIFFSSCQLVVKKVIIVIKLCSKLQHDSSYLDLLNQFKIHAKAVVCLLLMWTKMEEESLPSF